MHSPDFQLAAATRLENQVTAVRRPRWALVAAARCQLQQMTGCDVGNKDLETARTAPCECYIAAVGRPGRGISMTAPGDERPLISTARVHDVNLWLAASV